VLCVSLRLDRCSALLFLNLRNAEGHIRNVLNTVDAIEYHYSSVDSSTSISFYRATAMQAGYCDEQLSVCPSVRQSDAWIVTKQKHLAKKVQL